MYKNMVTLIGYPVKGKAKVGYDPEEELKKYLWISRYKVARLRR